MKKATKEMLEKCINLKDYIESKDIKADLKPLNKHEQALVDFGRFFEHEEPFDVRRLFRDIDLDWIPFAFDLLTTYYYEDTYLAKGEKPLIIKDKSALLNQTEFAKLLQEHGSNMDPKKIHMYYKRGKLPKEALKIGNTPYWMREDVESYVKENRQ